MDDSCAVCAENLEWVAYGSCGHREVCSTCVVRLRFVLGDPRCCICKTESPTVFVTKALGDYTRTITDFSTFPQAPKEGRVVGSFWYHEDTQAFFDDLDQYRMIKAMCRLSCGVCDKAEDQQPREGGPGPGPRHHHRQRIKSVEQLKGHLYHKHKLHMCGLCLEGRKIFICEQKLYTRAQLNQHIHTGDSEVDGTESERGGFTGHPMCEFCRNPFYGDNELYTHMTTEHYTCHFCQRSNSGQYEYYKNYDDLEIHFRRDHFICEDDSCLAKKFIVFQNESELKRHNAVEHGGKMSRSQRSAALQIPTSFRYRRGNDQENRRGRARSFRREPGDDDYNHAVHEALRLSEAEYSRQEPAPPPSSAPPGSSENNNIHRDDAGPLIQPMESLSTTDMEPSSRYLQAVGSSGGGGSRLGESAFPPLSGPPRSGQNLESLPTNTMAARLRRQTNRTSTASAIASPSQGWPAVNRSAAQTSITTGGNHSSSGWPAIARTPIQASSSSVQPRSHARVSQPRPLASAVPQAIRNANKIPHSSSAPDLSDTRSLTPSPSDFPPVSSAVVQNRRISSSTTQGSSNTQPPPDVQSANKSLIEKMRSALGHDEDVFMAFKTVSGQYRQGSIDARTYLEYVNGYGLSHLVIDLARLCPDPRRQKELIDTHNASLENGQSAAQSSSQPKDNQNSKKNKGKAVKVVEPKETLAENFMDTVRRLQSSQNLHEGEEEVISNDKNTYRSDKGKAQVASPVATSTSSKQPRKKTSKFHRVRLGDGSMAALLDINNSNREVESEANVGNFNSNQQQSGVIPFRGVWRKGGANLFS
ncbi:PREDICTED: E3 ubiquitin-protein ligase hel2 isoform X2 [Camelina sativa]|uniref:RING-type E3 ubiquitin transferase n=1 Tax=Camelina sativa TaxID=90675 RepID=A0ABM0ZA55_CAMSA|nr:PREDICTED: E3 ubiquitin-protein ligase hel2 isoform X1 [Camelina sativa]XP_010512609.1 PREDICTED: E3 ubiquitin-protein ligase hel2 isoform X2 [Camelina sativa]